VIFACLELCLSPFDKTLCSLLQRELTSLFELGDWLDLSWFQGDYGLLPLRNLEFWLLPSWVGKLVFAILMAWFERELVLYHVYLYFYFSLAFSSYPPKSFCFTSYTSLYLLNYVYHCARVSSNEMWNSFARPCLIACYDCNVEHMLKFDNSTNCSCSPLV
jgi:hypothetical protein